VLFAPPLTPFAATAPLGFPLVPADPAPAPPAASDPSPPVAVSFDQSWTGCGSDVPPPGSPLSCDDQAAQGACGQPWMQGHCNIVCGRCASPPPPPQVRRAPAPPKDCSQDVLPPFSPASCAAQAAWGQCGAEWMQGYCARACGQCAEGPAIDCSVDVPVPGSSSTCAQQRDWGQCGAPWMKESFCARSCERCPAPPPPPVATAPPPPPPPAVWTGCGADVPPPPSARRRMLSSPSCAQQAAWGKCSAPWMDGYCTITCGRCEGQVPAVDCSVDVPVPGSQYACSDQASWGQCGADWMRGVFCGKSCARCAAPPPPADPPITLAPALEDQPVALAPAPEDPVALSPSADESAPPTPVPEETPPPVSGSDSFDVPGPSTDPADPGVPTARGGRAPVKPAPLQAPLAPQAPLLAPADPAVAAGNPAAAATAADPAGKKALLDAALKAKAASAFGSLKGGVDAVKAKLLAQG